MNVLLLTQVLPYPPDSGPKVKTWNVLKYLAERHTVMLLSFVRGDQTRDVDELRRFCHQVWTVPMQRSVTRDALAMGRSLVTGQPWMMLRDDLPEMRAEVDRLAREQHFDVAHADQLNMVQYAQRVSGAHVVFDAHNALWLLYRRLAATMPQGPRRWLLERDWRLLKTYEGRIVRACDGVLAVSEEDRAALGEAAGAQPPITVIPIAVDTDEVCPVARRPEASHIVHVGTMYWPPNIDAMRWFVREVYPLVRRERPDAVFDMVGSRPPAEFVQLSNPASGIHVAGYVPDTTPYLEQAGVFIVPVRAGGGMRVKILNALAQGLPIVSTTLGAEGIAVVDGEHVLLADTPEGFAQAVLRVLNDPALAQRLSAAGRRLAEELYDYRVACKPMDAVYARCR